MMLVSLLLLLGVANFAPIVAKKLLGEWFDAPLDRGLTLSDGQPVFGASKTIRGVAASVVCTAAAAPLLELDWTVGAILAAGSMVGDLLSSFAKRRFRLRVHAQAFGLDQIPEALLPLLLLQARLGLAVLDIAGIVGAFVLLEVLLSRVLFRLHIRDQPY
jgi:CDP-2,3-bis-(O-geranylgeranyl)-sn-glycerol synthase